MTATALSPRQSSRGSLLLAGAVLLAAAVSPHVAAADEASVLPFFGKPYPYGYVGGHRTCEVLRPVETPDGIHYERVWICEPVLHSRG